MKLSELKEGQYIYFYTSEIPSGVYKKDGVLKEYSSWGVDKTIRDPSKFENYLKTVKWKLCKNYHEFGMTLRTDYLEPQLYEIAISGKCVNYPVIKEEVDRLSGKYHKDGFYLVGATSGMDDYYYLYWNPNTKKFKYSSCVGYPGVEDNETRELPGIYMEELRKLVKTRVYDAVFPSSYLQTPLG